ncbi:type II secretion system GspH family protein [bacterium]|nr:type II secretion system GspH family protein [bacterium]
MSQKSFTLIELLVVIAIVGILTGFLIISVSNAIKNADDTKRKADIRQIVNALLVYNVSNLVYPIASCNIGQNCPSEVNNALGNLVNSKDPTPGNYYSYSSSDGNSFIIGAITSEKRLYQYNSLTSQYSTSAVVGECGTANKSYYYSDTSFGSDTFCSSGFLSVTPSFPSPDGTSSWVCNGSSVEENVSCSASRNQALGCTNTHDMNSGILTISSNDLIYCVSGTASGTNNIAINPNISTTIIFDGATTVNMASQSKPAISLGSNSSLNIILSSGITVSLTGGNAANGITGGSNNGADTAPVAGGYAGINVPSTATLKIYGSGNLTTQGGNAGNGGTGGIGGTSCEGSGGSGGGGAGAGIGGNGGASGAGNGHVATTYTVFSGSAGENSGSVYIFAQNVNSYGGNGGNGGAGGSSSYNNGSGGGGGYPGAGIGGGGAGGGGAGWRSDGGGGYSGGGGGGTGYTSGIAGTNGSAGGNGQVDGSTTSYGGGGYLTNYGYGYYGNGNGGTGGTNGTIYRVGTFSGTIANGKAANGTTVINTRNQSVQGYGGGYGYTEGGQGTIDLNYSGS